ncbi:hypothetical protein MMC13_004065 [Lambiella insularis]|nr:hypothetical protein [Lambiella insularis]
MSGYSARKAPNVSQCIANLNTVPSAPDVAAGQQDGYPSEDDLAIFTNAEFFDFDLGDNIDSSITNYDPGVDGRDRPLIKNDSKDLSNEAYHFSGLPFVPTDPTALPTLDTSFSIPPFDLTAFGDTSVPFNITQTPQTGDKRPYSAVSQTPTTPSLDDSSRAAAEEDKRRRNTAASARFRVKKKQREQALEKTAKEMTDRADTLEARIAQLEMENKWLRNLVVEKTSKGKEDVAELYKRFTAENEGRSTDSKKKGVGTDIKDDVERKEE